jgi:hypothetical protein
LYVNAKGNLNLAVKSSQMFTKMLAGVADGRPVVSINPEVPGV